MARKLCQGRVVVQLSVEGQVGDVWKVGPACEFWMFQAEAVQDEFGDVVIGVDKVDNRSLLGGEDREFDLKACELWVPNRREEFLGVKTVDVVQGQVAEMGVFGTEETLARQKRFPRDKHVSYMDRIQRRSPPGP